MPMMTPHRCIWCQASPSDDAETCGECGQARLDLSQITLAALQAEAESRGLTVLVRVHPARAPVGPIWIHVGTGTPDTAAKSSPPETSPPSAQGGPDA